MLERSQVRTSNSAVVVPAIDLRWVVQAVPGATVLTIDDGQLRPPSYQLTRVFLNAPERYHRHLFRSEQTEEE